MGKKRMLEGNIDGIVRAMKECKSIDDYRRIQCVYLGMRYPEMSAKEVGETTLYSESRVWAIHADYRKNGISGLMDSRGGRYRQYMTVEEETAFLAPFKELSQTGAIVVIGKIKKAYETKIGIEVAESTIYRLLDRHDFRKIVPYKRHKKANIEEQETFKKTSFPSS